MPTQLVSVIVPAFNRAYVLPRAVESALAQTHAAVEVIVVDDGSTDDTARVVRERWSDDPRVRYSWRPNGGPSAARNHAIPLVKGEFAAFLDSDDEWVPWKLELQLACLAAFPQAGMCWTNMTAVSPEGDVVDECFLMRMYEAWRWFRCEDIFERSLPLLGLSQCLDRSAGELLCSARAWFGDVFSPMVAGSLVHTSTVVLRRERLARVGEFDETLRFSGEDYDFHLRTCREGPVVFADVPTMRYQRGMPDRLTRPEYRVHVATNFLRTLTRTLERDRSRIRLPRGLLRSVQADAHAWVAETSLAAGDRAAALRHLARSLAHQPVQPMLAARIGLEALSPRLAALARSGLRRVRRPPGGRASAQNVRTD